MRVDSSSFVSPLLRTSWKYSSLVDHVTSWVGQRYIHHYKPVAKEYAVFDSVSLQHPFKKWQALRKNKLTASTFAGAVGFWPRRRVQLWLEKLGAIEPFKGNMAIYWNNIKEEDALETYKLIKDCEVVRPKFQVLDEKNSEHSWLGASPDGLALQKHVYELSPGGVLEIKCPYFGGEPRKNSPWKRIPVYYMPQAQGLLEIMDRDWMHFYCWTPNESSLFRIERDVEYWAILREALSDFWWKHVQPAKELCSEHAVSEPCVQLFKPEPRHELCGDIVYYSKLISNKSELLWWGPHKLPQTW